MSSTTMGAAEGQDKLEDLFKTKGFVNHYKTAERVAGQFAKDLVDQSQLLAEARINPNARLTVLDNACGTGVISSILQRELDDNSKHNSILTCGDISSSMLDYTKHRMEQEGWVNAETKLVDAQDTKLPSAYYTHVISAFAYMVLPQSLKALDETCRILQPGGTLACSTWIEPGWLPVMKSAIETMPGNLPWPTPGEFLDALNTGKWHSVAWVKSQLDQRDLEDVNVNVITKNISMSVPELVEMIMVMFPMVTQYFWTADQRQEHAGKIRQMLQGYLADTYGENQDVPTVWIAILATARKPMKELGPVLD